MIGPQHPVSQLLHQNKYRSDGESFDDYAVRYARTLADDERHFRHLLGAVREQRILPAGRQQLAIGRPHQTTAYNCFVGGTISDSMAGIMTELKRSAMTLRAGGGCGWDFSTIRPEKDPIYGLGPGAFASGPVGFMPLWHAMCSSIMSAGMRRGAMMGSVSCHHPDVMKFIRAKRVPPELTPIFEAIRELPEGPVRKAAEKAAQRLLPLTNFNISVGCTDAFMDAVENDGLYDLTFGGRVYQRVRALDVWAVIMENNWDWAEPGVLFFDRINQMNPLRYCETIASTNPCAEQPLPPFGACLLGSLNMVKYLVPTYSRILHPHTANGKPPSGEHHSRYIRGYELDMDLFRDDVRATVRAFDNVIENTVYPLPEQEAEAKAKRRMGVGITGMANALEVCGHVYGTPAYLEAQESILAILRDTAYETSIDLAGEKGSFPLFDADKWLGSGFAQTLPEPIRERIRREGLRNGLLLSIAPTGCQRPDTMVVTEDGILELHELGQLAGPQWQPLGLAVCADRGQPIASRFYNNGIVDTVTLSMRSGVHLEATPTHRYRAIRDGSYVWLRCDEVVEGDRLVVAIGGYNKDATAEPALAAVGQLHGNEQLIRQPEKASPLLGWFLGVYFANGSDHRKGVRIAFNSSQDKWRKVQRVATELFGFEPIVEDNGRGCLSLYLSRQSLKRWLAANGLTKGRSRSICVPILVRRMSRESLAAFVEGYFYGDGTIQFPGTPHPVRCVATASPVMARQLAVIIRALGNDVSCDGYVSGKGSWIHRLRIVHGCRKDERREDRQVLDRLGLGHCTVDCVVAVGHGRCLTLDLEVPEGNTYLANGVVSHNTISLTADNISSGIEPPFALELEREINLAEGRATVAFNDYAFDRFGVRGRTAMECTPQDHIRVLCSAQKYIDSSCSKTCNVNGARGGDVQPGEITFQEFKDLYWLAWKGGAKGCTTYNANGQRAGILTAKAQSGNLRSAAQIPTTVRSGNGETAHDGADTEGAACFLDPTTGMKSCDS